LPWALTAAPRAVPELRLWVPELAHVLAPARLAPHAGGAAVALLASALLASRPLRQGESLLSLRLLGCGVAVAWALAWSLFAAVVEPAWQQPLRRLALQAHGALPPGAPIRLVELNHRVEPQLATGRVVVYARATDTAAIGALAGELAGPAPVRLVLPAPWWDRLQSRLGGREVARDGPYVLVGN
jgi:hypothetical protein